MINIKRARDFNRTPPKLRRRDEDRIVKGIISDFDYRFANRNFVRNHSPNEGNRGGAKGAIDGLRRKEMGVLAGFPDILFIGLTKAGKADHFMAEVKTAKGTVASNQKALHERLRALGWDVYVVRDIAEMQEIYRARGWI